MNQKEEQEMIDKAIKDYVGQIPTLETGIGAYFVGKKLGWKPLLLIHDKQTIKKYGKILDIDFKAEMKAEGEWAHKSMAWKAVKKVSNFWKAVSGDIPGIRSTEMK